MTPHAERLIEILRYVLALQPGEQAELGISPSDLLVSEKDLAHLQGATTRLGEAWFSIEKTIYQGSQEQDGSLFVTEQPHPLTETDQHQSSQQNASKLHERLAGLYRDLKMDGGAETMEVVCGFGFLLGLLPSGEEVNAPLILQACEIILNAAATSTIELHPATNQPTLNTSVLKRLYPARSQEIEQLQQELQQSEAEFSTDDSTSLTPFYDKISAWGLGISPSWSFFLRKRPSGRVRKDILALIEAIEAGATLPDGMIELVDRDYNPEILTNSIVYRGLETTGERSEGELRELYFPLPYNDEQVNIIQRLEVGNGAVVQGPPGTGKSHTIANIICHYLATGRSVLVSSGSAGALDVIREKLPAEIRGLSAALLSSDAESIKQFEQSISEIVAKVSAIHPPKAQEEILAIEKEIKRLHACIEETDHEMEEIAKQNLMEYVLGGKLTSATEIAKIALQEPENPFFSGPLPEIPFEKIEAWNSDTAKCRALLGDLLDDEEFFDLPENIEFDVSLFNEWSSLVDLQNNTTLEPDTQWISLLSDVELESTLAWLEKIGPEIKNIETSSLWNDDSLTQYRVALMGLKQNDPVRTTILKLAQDARTHQARVRYLDGRIVMNNAALGNAKTLAGIRKSISNLAEGKRAIPLLSFGQDDVKQFIESVYIDGDLPDNRDQWLTVGQRIEDLLGIAVLIRRWNAMAQSMAAWPTIDMKRLGSLRALQEIDQLAKLAIVAFRHAEIQSDAMDKTGQAWTLFGKVTPEALNGEIQVRRATGRILEIRQKIERTLGSTLFGIRALSAMSHPDKSGDIQTVAVGLTERYARMTGALEVREQLNTIAREIQATGAKDLAAALLATRNETADAQEILDGWTQSWKICAARRIVQAFGEPGQMFDLIGRRQEYSRSLSMQYQSLITEKSWLKMFENSTPRVRQSLQKYLGAVRKIGQGTGMRAARHRAVAKEAMQDAYMAIPCWIMPQGRVSESMPASLGLFDLVIMDEASQSGIDAIMTLMRGKKVLIVGDDKQVSPSGVGRDELTIIKNRNTLLSHQPYAHRMLPDQSIYDLFSEVFAGSTIMLKEHFRSSGAIIEYSNREFYGGQIIPLRVPNGNQRIDPPLVDVLVLDGKKEGDINEKEAIFIAEEIKNISENPAFSGKTIGVVTLTSSEKQAMEIKRHISARISDSAYTAMEISVGPPAQFQGKERDIMFVSMVWDEQSRDPGNRVDFQQRFNVALSRARDRMYLVRSIRDGHAKTQQSVGSCDPTLSRIHFAGSGRTPIS